MATLEAIVSGTSLTLNDGNPYTLVSARGMSGPPVRRVIGGGPNQFGDTDLGYRLQPRDIELVIGFYAATDSALDTHRRTLNAQFKPLSSTAINLRYTRDDAVVRQIDCHAVGKVRIALVPEHRPGHYHEATISLHAPDPAFYNPNPGTITVQGTASLPADWYLAGGAIGTARVLMYGGTPAQGEAWSYAGSISAGTTWTLALRTTQEAFGTAEKYMFHVDNTGSSETDLSFRAGTADYRMGNSTGYASLGASWMSSGTVNYFFDHDPDAFPAENSAWVGTVETTILFSDQDVPIGGTARRWRSNAAGSASTYWGGTISLYALYSPGLAASEIAELEPYMNATVGGTTYSTESINYLGDLHEYPIISITGPVSGPLVYSNGKSLDFSGVTIGAGTTYVIDTRPEYKSIYAGTVNKKGDLSTASNLGDWSITPENLQGINTFIFYGSATSAATTFEIVYYTRYSSI